MMKKVPFPSWAQEAHVWDMKKNKEKRTKFQMSNQRLGVNQLLGVTPIHWPTNIFLHFSSGTLHESLVRMMKEVLLSRFLNVFNCFWPCKRMPKHGLAGQNTQHATHLKRKCIEPEIIIWMLFWATINHYAIPNKELCLNVNQNICLILT